MSLISVLVFAVGVLCIAGDPVALSSGRMKRAVLPQPPVPPQQPVTSQPPVPSERRKRSTNTTNVCQATTNPLNADEYEGTDIDDVLAYHNNERAKIDATAMNEMNWSVVLSEHAQYLAETCKFEHSNHAECKEGQNLFITDSVNDTWLNATNAWGKNEKPHYNYIDNTCKQGKICGHYTQAVHAETRYVGCAKHTCNVMTDNDGEMDGGPYYYYVCNYKVAGNVQGQKPYKEGTPCSECQSDIGVYCAAGKLCVPCYPDEYEDGECTCPTCENGGTLNASDCTCQCASGYLGRRCEIACADKNEDCGQWKDDGYCASTSDYYSYMQKTCNKSCEFCSTQ